MVDIILQKKELKPIDAEKDIHLIGETLTVRSPITCKFIQQVFEHV